MPLTSIVERVDTSASEVRSTEGKDLLARKYVMILAEHNGDLRLPMWIRPAEATAPALAPGIIGGPAATPRPLRRDVTDAVEKLHGGGCTPVHAWLTNKASAVSSVPLGTR